MKFLTSLAILFCTAQAFAGGDMPFPFDGEAEQAVVNSANFHQDELGLLVEVKQYKDHTKVWLRADNRFVFDRCFFDGGVESKKFGCAVGINGQVEVLSFDFTLSPSAQLTWEGEGLPLRAL